MGQQRVFFIYLFTSILLIFPVATVSAADNANAKYSWMLPKTVIDVQIVYTFKKCSPVDPSKPEKGVTLSFDVAPTLTP